jgi:hypothetical protein
MKLADGGPMFGDNLGASTLQTWQAAGLSLAAGALAAIKGPGAVAAAVALAPMVWAFGRLHRNAPSAGSDPKYCCRPRICLPTPGAFGC